MIRKKRISFPILYFIYIFSFTKTTYYTNNFYFQNFKFITTLVHFEQFFCTGYGYIKIINKKKVYIAFQEKDEARAARNTNGEAFSNKSTSGSNWRPKPSKTPVFIFYFLSFLLIF
jgi:hypothetical protein